MATELIPADGDDLAALAARINAEYKEATAHLHKGLVHALEVGRLLIEAKARLPHGQWGRWLHENVYIAERTVREYMQLAQELPTMLAEESQAALVGELIIKQAVFPEGHRLPAEGRTPPVPEPQPVVEPQPAEAEHSAAGRSDGIAEALHLYQSQAERVPVLELQLREAQARASTLEALLARLRAERTAASTEQSAKVKKATKKEIHELEERLYKAYEDRLMDMNTHLMSYQMCYELFRDQCHKLEETIRKEEYKARITLVQPVGKAGPAGPNYLRGRGAGLYHFRPPWGDPAFDNGYRYGVGSSLVTTVEAYKAEDAAKTFVRQFAYDGDPEDAYADPKPYTGRLKIEPITSALDHEPIFQGYRHAPPPPDLPPELSWWGAAAERFEEEATRLEWRKLWQPLPDWGSFESYWDLPIVEKNNPEIAQQLKEAWRGEGPPVCWRIFHRRVPPADRQRWAEPLHDAEIAAWRKENEWQGGEWAPVGPRFHVDGPFPLG